MDDQPTTTPRPRPDWLCDLTDARIRGDEYLTRTEQDLLAAATLLIRARTGRTQLDDPKTIARDFVRCALTDLKPAAVRA